MLASTANALNINKICEPTGGQYDCLLEKRKVLSQQIHAVGQSIKKLHADVGSLMPKADADWRKFAESDCRARSETANMAQGSGYARVYEACMYQEYYRRLKDLREYAAWLKKYQAGSH